MALSDSSRADEIQAGGEWARGVLESKHKARETTLAACRKTIQACAASIRAVHREQFDAAEELSAQAAAHLAEALKAVEAHQDIRYAGFVHDASKEYAEARMTLAFVRGDPLPAAADLGVEVQAYLNGMAEAASELRRYLLDLLRRGRPERGEELLGYMDDVYSLLITIDFPDAMTGGLRRTTDALRGVLERTRGDLTTSLLQTRLLAGIEAHRQPSPDG
ncbi:MAG TPA: haloacid dehalogenase [Acidimicrobiia bacterium]|nr:haloacid dehalogenase [Acidimicrobiia bacterium]